MAVTFSSVAKVPGAGMDAIGVFDPILDLDTRLFLDPHLLSHTTVPELLQSYERLHDRFKNIATLLLASEQRYDRFWRQAESLMTWPEVKGLCIGYTSRGTAGHGMGAAIRGRLLETASVILRKGINEPVIFELVGLFEKDIGPDLIGDMTANVIRDDLIRYSLRVLRHLGVTGSPFFNFDTRTSLPINPFNGQPVTLIPRELLRDLPVALDWSDRDAITVHNAELRSRVNELIGNTWKQAAAHNKEMLKNTVLSHVDVLLDLIDKYKRKPAQRYDFEEDRAGQYVWVAASKQLTSAHPLPLHLPATPSVDAVEGVVLQICSQFKKLVEENNLSKLFYDKRGRPKHEEAMQLLFYGISESYCDANSILIARESDAGRGPVDFKFGTKKENSVLVEVKKSTNVSGLKKGVDRQLPAYMNAEGSQRAIYLVIDVGYSRRATKIMTELEGRVRGTAIRIYHVQGYPKPSGSRA